MTVLKRGVCIFCLKESQLGQTICNVCDARRKKPATDEEAARQGGSAPIAKADMRSVENKQYGDPPREGCGFKGEFPKTPVFNADLDEIEIAAVALAVKHYRQRLINEAHEEALELFDEFMMLL